MQKEHSRHCEICGEYFKTNTQYTKPMTQLHRLDCDYCNKTLKGLEEMEIHLQAKYIIACDICRGLGQ